MATSSTTHPAAALLADSTVTIDPIRFWITQVDRAGHRSTLHLVQNDDLAACRDLTGGDLTAATGGRIVIALDIDGDVDAVHYDRPLGAGAEDTLRRGLEVLALALEGVLRADGRGTTQGLEVTR